jgi:hypothetical protein
MIVCGESERSEVGHALECEGKSGGEKGVVVGCIRVGEKGGGGGDEKVRP